MAVKSLREFTAQSNELDRRFEKARGEGPAPLDAAYAEEIVEWLRTCAQHGRYLPDNTAERRALQGILDYWVSRLLQVGHVAPAEVEELAGHEAEAGVALTVECPYPGLDAYREDKNAIFFGRGPLIDEYVAHLEDSSKRVLLVIGASGSGKSSLALAGMLPMLKEHHAEDWLFPKPFTPGASPRKALAIALADTAGVRESADAIENALKANAAGALDYLGDICGGRSPMLTIDQFEELFTVCRSTEEQMRFADILVNLSDPLPDTATCKPRILLTIRTDYIARVENNAGLQHLRDRLFRAKNDHHLSGLAVEDIRRAIADPARQVGLRFPAALVDQIAVETAALPNGLPSLQFALRWLWDNRPQDENGNRKDLITEEMIRRLPSVKKALGTVANGIYEGFNENQQGICRRLLLELIVLDETFEEPLRRRRRETELLEVLRRHAPGAPDDPSGVIEAFVAAGLVRRFGEGANSQLEVAHEALLRHWQEFSDILDVQGVKAQLNLVKQIGREAAEWIARSRSESYLNLKGERLERARQHADEGWLEEVESAEYVRACVELESRVIQEKKQAADDARRTREAQEAARESELQQARAEARAARAEARAERVKKQRTTSFAVGLMTLLLLTGGLGYWIKELRSERDRSAREKVEQEKTSAANRDANLTAYTSIASTLPPWDDLDVAYTLVRKQGEYFWLPLARALERMEDTKLVGNSRGLGVFSNQDGSAIRQLERDAQGNQTTLRVYLLGEGERDPGEPIEFDLRKPDQELVFAEIGPPIPSAPSHRLALLVFRKLAQAGFTVEVYRLDSASPGATKQGETQDLGKVARVSSIGFHRDGDRAAFVAIDYDAGQSTIYIVALRVENDALITKETAHREANIVDQATAVALVDDSMVTGRLDGQVVCTNQKRWKMSAVRPEDEGSPVRQIVDVPGEDWLLLLRESGSVYELNCSDGANRLVTVARDSLGMSLTSLPRATDSGRDWLLSFMQGQKLHCRRRTASGWNKQPCNAQHQAHFSVPLNDGRQMTIEDSRIPALHTYPLESLSDAHLARKGRRAGNTTIRWTPPGASPTGSSAPADNAVAGPWRNTGAREFEAQNFDNNVHLAALSPDGERVAWVERGRLVRHAAVHQGQQFWRLRYGRIRETRIEEVRVVEHLPAPPSILAIPENGPIAHAEQEPPQPIRNDSGSPYTVKIGNSIIDDHRDETVKGWGDRTVSCLQYSPSGERILAGTITGRIMTWRKDLDSPLGWKRDVHWSLRFDDLVTPSDETRRTQRTAGSDARKRQQITACAIADDGEVVIGGADGDVVRLTAEGEVQHLTQRVAFRFDAPVQEVAINHGGPTRFITVLGAWQTTSCSRRGLPGQAVRVWDTGTLDKDKDDSFSPVASTCLPNQVVLSLGDIGSEQYPPNIPLLTARKLRPHLCWGCAVAGMTTDEMVETLLGKAEEKHAQELTPEALYIRYGLKLTP